MERLNARLKAPSDLYPTWLATCERVVRWVKSRRAASCMRQRVRYCSGDSPASEVKRAAKAESDKATAVANMGTVHSWSGRSSHPLFCNDVLKLLRPGISFR